MEGGIYLLRESPGAFPVSPEGWRRKSGGFCRKSSGVPENCPKLWYNTRRFAEVGEMPKP